MFSSIFCINSLQKVIFFLWICILTVFSQFDLEMREDIQAPGLKQNSAIIIKAKYKEA